MEQAEGSTEPVTNPNSSNKTFNQNNERSLKTAQNITSIARTTILKHIQEAT
jgi:hypothetical protein